MENIEAFYTLALIYGFVSFETYRQIVLKININHKNNNEELINSQAEEYSYV
jgi:hypothetical protein